MRIVFAGTPDFAVPCLQALVAAGHEIVAVYTQPDRPAGRGRKLRASAVKQAAETIGLAIKQPESLRDAQAQTELLEFEPELMVVVAYGQILPQSVLDIPKLGCLNVHASLLPRWRGAAPIQRALQAGDARTGVCVMQMEAGLDTGPVLLQNDCEISSEDCGGTLHDRLSEMGASALVSTVEQLGELTPQAQDNNLASYAHKLDTQETWIDWSQSAIVIDRMIRAFNPWPVSRTSLDGVTFRIFVAAIEAEHSHAAPGKILSAGPQGIAVATGQGQILLQQIQPANGRRMTAAAYAQGHDLNGQTFGHE